MAVIDEAKDRMDNTVDAVGREFTTVRTGKAVPAILDSVRVSAYGSQMPVNQVATVSVPDPSLLVVQPFDPSLLADVERAILSAGLGLNPSNDGSRIRVPIPPLNEERRREYVRLLNRMAEDGRISIRQARQAANEDVKKSLKVHEIGEDEARRLMAEIQKLTLEYGGRIDALLAEKEKEVMAI